MISLDLVIVHDDDGTMRDTWGRSVLSGPEERWPEDDPRYYDRAVPEPCDDSYAPDACRLCYDHVGVCMPTPEQATEWYKRPDRRTW